MIKKLGKASQPCTNRSGPKMSNYCQNYSRKLPLKAGIFCKLFHVVNGFEWYLFTQIETKIQTFQNPRF